jgi:hypothetical protein
MVILTAVRPGRASVGMTRSDRLRRLPGRLLVAFIGVGEPAERIDDDRQAFPDDWAAAATAGSRALAPAMPRNRRRSKEKENHSSSGISRELIGAEIGPVVAPPALHREDYGSKIADIPQRIGGDHRGNWRAGPAR